MIRVSLIISIFELLLGGGMWEVELIRCFEISVTTPPSKIFQGGAESKRMKFFSYLFDFLYLCSFVVRFKLLSVYARCGISILRTCASICDHERLIFLELSLFSLKSVSLHEFDDLEWRSSS